MYKRIFLMQFIFCGFLFAQQPYDLPFASKDNSIELAVVNKSNEEVKEITVKAINLPKWIIIENAEEIIQSIKPVEEAAAFFSFSVNKEAPVNKQTILNFLIKNTNGEEWYKEILVKVCPPDKYELYQNYPNPFNPVTTISYQLPVKSNIELKIYDMLGKEMVTLVNITEDAGYHKLEWNAQPFASGIYFYQLSAKSEGKKELLRKKMMVIK